MIRQNKCQMRFLDKLVLKKDVDKKLMINSITCSILESPSYSDDDDTYYVFSESKVLEPKIKHLIKKQAFSVGQHAIWKGGKKI